MKKTTVTLIALLALLTTASCGKVSGNEDQTKESNNSGVVSPLDPAAPAAGSPPAYVSHATLTSTQFEVTLTKECTDATGLNSANFILSNGLQITGIAKKSGDARTLVITTTIQQAISYNLTMLNLVATDGGVLNGVLQISFTGLPSPAITSIDWRNPTDTANTLPATLGVINLCQLTSGSGSNCTNAPFYNHTSLYGILTGANATAYRYKIDAGAWSGDIPLATPLTVTGLSEGFHTIYIIGRHTNGYWQSETAADVYTKSWVQDTVAPTAQLDPLTLPASVTASLSLSVRAVGADVSYFRYCLDNGTINDCVTNTWRGSPDLASAGLAIPNAVYTANLVPGSVRVRVIGIDVSGNVQSAPVAGGTYSYTIDTGAVEAVFQLSDLTAITPVMTSVTVNVLGSSGAAAYKGKIVDGTDCNTGTGWDALPEQPLTTPITATGLSDTVPQKTVCAIGKSVSGLYWQGGWTGTATAPIITKYTWTIDTTPPTTIINWIDPVAQPTTTTKTSGYELQISSTGAAISYRYALVTGAGASCASATYNAEVTADTAITLGAPAIATTGVTVYKVCVIGKDAAGNWQPVSSATSTAEWTVDAEPPANNPAFTAASSSVASFGTPVINFFIDNGSATSDTQTYRIQVAKDTGFTQIISDTNVPSCKNIVLPDCPAALGTKQFTIAVDPYNSGSIYARVQAGDPYGNFRSDFSAVSAEHYVRGRITGTLRSTSGTALSGVAVRLYQASPCVLDAGDANVCSLAATYADQTTNASGVFTFTNVRTGKNLYRVIAARGDATYRAAAKRSVSVQAEGASANTVTNVGTMTLVPQSATAAQDVVAKVVDADDGWMLGYAEVKLVDALGLTVGTAVRSTYNSGCTTVAPVGDPPSNIPKQQFSSGGICGDVLFTNVTPGNYSIEVTGNSWAANQQVYNLLRQENVVVPGLPEARTLIIRAGNTTGSNIYDPITNAVRNGPPITGSPNTASHGFRIATGLYASKYMLIDGNSNTTRVYNPIDNGTFAGPNLNAAANTGSMSLSVTAGVHNGKYIIFHGSATTSDLYDPAANTMTASGITLAAALGAGAHGVAITSGVQSGKYLIIRGGATNAVYIYDPAAHTFSTPVYTLPAAAGAGAFSTLITSGANAGKILIVLGNGSMNTALYELATDTMAAGPGLSAIAGAGASAFPVSSGIESGNMVFVHGGNTSNTSVYVTSTGLFAAGPGLDSNPLAGAGGSNFLIESGTNSGRQFVIHGNALSTTSLYDATTNTFVAGPALTGAVNTGGYVIKVAPVTAGRLPLVRTLVGQDLKIVLAWGNENPRDLDMHMVGTLPAGQTHTNPDDNCVNDRFHVNWRRSAGNWQQQYSAKTRTFIQPDPAYQGQQFFPLNPDTTAALVQDATTGFGPEAINLIGGYTNGTYWLTVVNWSQWNPSGTDTKANQQWDVTNVQLKVYDADGLAFEMTATEPATTPTALAPAVAEAGCGLGGASDWQQCELWNAFSMTVSGSGSAGRSFTPVNTYVNWNAGGTMDYNKCNLSGF